MPVATVKWFDVQKGFGFIQGPEGEKDIFVHYSVIETEGFKTLQDRDKVEYEVSNSGRGPHASHVRVLTQDQPEPAK